MQAMINEAEKWAGMVKQSPLRDAGLVASAQRVEHYEIALRHAHNLGQAARAPRRPANLARDS
jgi:ferritin-like metal-binding protein YciE